MTTTKPFAIFASACAAAESVRANKRQVSSLLLKHGRVFLERRRGAVAICDISNHRHKETERDSLTSNTPIREEKALSRQQ